MIKKNPSEETFFVLIIFGFVVLIVGVSLYSIITNNVFFKSCDDTCQNEKLEEEARRFCDSLMVDGEVSGFLFQRVNSNVVENGVINILSVDYDRFGSDLINDSLTLWEVVCESEAVYCPVCNERVVKDCYCNSIIFKHHFNLTEIKKGWR